MSAAANSLPRQGGERSGLMRRLNILLFNDDPDILYAEESTQSHMTANPQSIQEGSLSYDRLQAAAPSVEDSAVLIARVMEERYGEQPESDERSMAQVVVQRHHRWKLRRVRAPWFGHLAEVLAQWGHPESVRRSRRPAVPYRRP